MEFINLTPHTINVGGREIPPSGMVARVMDKETNTFNIEGIPVAVLKQNDNSLLLPNKKRGRALLVSRAVAQVARREDVFFPSNFVRDRNGTVLEAKRLARFE